MDLREQIAYVAGLRERLKRARDGFNKAHEAYKRKAESVLHEEILKHRSVGHIEALVATCQEGLVYVYGMGDYLLFEDGWAKEDPDDTPGFCIPCEEGPMPWEDFVALWKRFEEATGLEVQFATVKRKKAPDPDNIRSFRDIELLVQSTDPGKTVKKIGEGKIWHIGWDIPDEYIAVEIDGEKWVWWSSDAHGGPLRHSAKDGTPECEDFKRWAAEKGVGLGW